MAHKRKNKGSRDERQATAMMYARAMGFKSMDEYLDWCMDQGFSATLNKSEAELHLEYSHFRMQYAKRKMKYRKQKGRMSNLIIDLFSGKLSGYESAGETIGAIRNGFNRVGNKKLLRDVLIMLDEKTKLMNHVDYIKGVAGMVQMYGKWVRPISEWTPNTHNAGRQFASLARHLFAKYPVPAFMDSAWQDVKLTEARWYIHLGEGKNIRAANDLPVRMTKKMAHYFTLAPDRYDVKSAFRWAQICALGGNKRIADAVVETRLVRDFRDDEFWLSVLRFFIENPMLDTSHYHPIIDYIWNQKYETRTVFIARGVAQEEGPEQPNFTMRGRTPESLLRQVDNWHTRLGKATRHGKLQWVKSRVHDYQFVEGTEKGKNLKTWLFRELLSSDELIDEGRKLGHCVATYASNCYSGNTSIWSLEMQDRTTKMKLLTIEVRNTNRTVYQIRGLRNRLATEREMAVIRRWIAERNLMLSRHL
ncbi:MAG: PcfJ domain-containing protein [Gammaproteobacteria bacterium]|nr:PcfJ domain-containing protein [Gammaproteobacteria bacterium]MDH5651996.1 PcfJ domain-containing protein [Gammaproteobacteria bacterium]